MYFNLFIFLRVSVCVTPAIDVYSFGMCALEMAALEIQGNGDSGTLVTEENINRTIESLDDEQQKDFIHKCLHKEPGHRPSARELLFHPLLFEVHSLKLLSAHALVYSTGKGTMRYFGWHFVLRKCVKTLDNSDFIQSIFFCIVCQVKHFIRCCPIILFPLFSQCQVCV
jgi:serine/threonine protein kinase